METIDSYIPKKPQHVRFSDKQCALCKNHGRPNKSHNTRDCHKFNPDSTHIKKNGRARNAQNNEQADKTPFKRERT
jgi:hypothetical protein